MKIINSLNANKREKSHKVFTEKSQTIPDQTMSIKVILERYAKGLPIANALDAIYEDEEAPSSGINPRTLDLVDLQELKRKNKEDIDYFTKIARTQGSKKKKNTEETVNEETTEQEEQH